MNLAEQMRQLSEKATKKDVDISKWLEKIKEAASSGKRRIQFGELDIEVGKKLRREGFNVETYWDSRTQEYYGTISW